MQSTTRLHGYLKQYFGYENFREGQEPLIQQLLGGGDCLGVMPTGAGKSLCYQVPALALDGLTLIISPLISLMKDQVDALRDAGVAAALVNSTLSPQERAEVMRDACAGRYKLLYLAPERLDAEDFRQVASRLNIALVAVDEAHCISQWGQDFRPSYLRIANFIESLPVRPPVGAFTATATAPVREDIISLLKLREPLTISTGFDRPNLYFAVKRPRDKDDAVIDFLRKQGEKGDASKSGIIYCATRAATDELHALLESEGFAVARYHAGMTEQDRRVSQNDFINDVRPIMVATNAFGMGIDKSNVGFVIHYNMPKNLESYYQEAGRAGRDGSPATCLLLYAPSDVATARYLIAHSTDSSDWGKEAREALQEKDLELLKHMTFYATTNDCLRRFILAYFGETTAPLCDNCSNCHSTFEEVDATVDAQKVLSCVFRLQERGRSLGKGTIVNILRGSKAQRITQLGLETLSTYGIMATVAPDRVYRVIDHLLATGHLALTGADYPVLQLANDWRSLLAKDAHYLIKVPKEVQ
ncbi:MAG: RecQ family ATP-dependent DNA helicase, partial [Coriobacteriales bacterium]|nr:RecQ family ATP-dependent DNA helicase [Coriobacteriales bacterium]